MTHKFTQVSLILGGLIAEGVEFPEFPENRRVWVIRKGVGDKKGLISPT